MAVIGIAASSKRGARLYLKTISTRGGNPQLVVPRTESGVDDIVSSIDALMLTGGPDVDPWQYQEDRNPEAGLELDPKRDQFEMDLFRGALDRHMPVLAICRGMQLLNVALGGKLIQDLPNHRAGPAAEDRESAYHRIYISPGSRLGAIIGAGGFVRVNSRHHQGLREAQKASSLIASAYSLDDGIIEAVESPDYDWVIGVQWHPEREDEMPKGFGNLFQGFLERAETFSEKSWASD